MDQQIEDNQSGQVHENTQLEPLPQARITEIQIKSDHMGKFTQYEITISDTQIHRRYNDFYRLHVALKLGFPGLYIPPIPQKQVIVRYLELLEGSMDDTIVKQRRRMLQLFIDELYLRPYLWNSKQNRMFYDQNNISISFHELPQLTYQQIVERYCELFPSYIHQEISYNMRTYLLEFNNHIANIKPMVENFKKMSLNFLNQKKQYQTEYGVFINFILPEYEKQLVIADRSRFLTESHQFTPEVRTSSINYDHNQLLLDLEIQELEVLSFLTCLDQQRRFRLFKDRAEERIRALQIDLQDTISDRRNFFEKLIRPNKNDEVLRLQTLLDNANQEVQFLQKIIDIVLLVLFNHEIPKFKSEKTNNFYRLLKIFGVLEIENAQRVENYWKPIIETDTLSQINLQPRKMLESVMIVNYDQNGQKQQEQKQEFQQVHEVTVQRTDSDPLDSQGII
ncbi:hypothetical protein pb186bvf_001415 [Paramecium bursaria]